MQSKTKHTIVTSVSALLMLGVVVSCCSTRNPKEVEPEGEKPDSVEQFIPLHPPVVIPHSWRDEK